MSIHSENINETNKKILCFCFYEAFPLIYGNNERQDSNSVELTFQIIKKHLQWLVKNCAEIFTKESSFPKVVNQLVQKLKIKNENVEVYPMYNFKVFPAYGCALILERQTAISNISVYIVFGTSWGTSMEICKSQIKQYPSFPSENRYIHMGEIETSEISLAETMRTLETGVTKMITELEVQSSRKNSVGSASQIQQAVASCLNYISVINGSLCPNYGNNHQKIVGKGGTQAMSKMVGLTRPDTILPIFLSLIYFLTENEQFVKIYQFSYQYCLLQTVIRNLNSTWFPERQQNKIQFINNKAQKVYTQQQQKQYNQQIYKLVCCCQLLTASYSDLSINNSKNCQLNAIYNGLGNIYDNLLSYNKKFKRQPFICTLQELNFTDHLLENNQKITSLFSMYFDTIQPNLVGQLSKIQFFKGLQKLTENNILQNLYLKIQATFSQHKIQTQKFMVMRQIEIIEDIVFTIALNELPSSLQFGRYYENVRSLYYLLTTYECAVEVLKNQTCKFFIGKRPNYQIISYFYLFKTIIAIIGFEGEKKKLEGSEYDLDDYKIPIQFNKIYKNFTALSAKAHAVAAAAKQYFQMKQDKKNFFKLSQQVSESTLEYIVKVYNQNDEMYQSYRGSIDRAQNECEMLKKRIQKYQHKHQLLQNQIIDHANRLQIQCQCYDEIGYRWTKKYINVDTKQVFSKKLDRCQKQMEPYVIKHVICSAHLYLQSLYYQLRQLEKQKDKKVFAEYPPKNPQAIFFFKHAKNEVGCLIDLILLSQIGKRRQGSGEQSFVNSYLQNIQKYTKLNSTQNIFVAKIKDYTGAKTFLLKNASPENVWDFVIYLNPNVSLQMLGLSQQFNEFASLSAFHVKDFNRDENFWAGYKFIIDPPPFLQQEKQMYNVQQIREHHVYQFASTLPRQINRSQFIMYASLRITTETEVILLLSQILSRNLVINSINESGPQKNIVRGIVSRLVSMQNIEKCGLSDNVNNAINNFLDRYALNLQMKDMNFLPILGPLIAFLSQYSCSLSKQQDKKWSFVIASQGGRSGSPHSIFFKILEFSLQIHETFKKKIERRQIQSEQGKIRQKFVAFTALCCFTQQILCVDGSREYDQLNKLFLKVFLNYGSTKIAKQVSTDAYMKAIQKYENVLDRTLFCNISSLIKYGIKHKNELWKIVKQFAEHSTEKDKEWEASIVDTFFIQLTNCNCKNTYAIDFCRGLILFNNTELAIIPESIQRSIEFSQLFGKSVFEAFHNHQNNSLQIRKKFQLSKQGVTNQIMNLLENEKIGQIGFEVKKIKCTGKEKFTVKFSLLPIQKNIRGTLQGWTRIPAENIDEKSGIPEYYRVKYRPWLNDDSRVIAFKSPELSKLHEISMIAIQHHANEKAKLYAIPQHYINKRLAFLLKNISKFDELELHQPKAILSYDDLQQKFKVLALQILCKIEKYQYIHTLNSKQKSNSKPQKVYWLHRYDLKFAMDDEYGLIPTTFSGYKLSLKPFTHDYLPWSRENDIPCLVFEKIEETEFTYQMHKTKVIIPNLEYVGGKFYMPKGANQQLQLFTYDIHDHFHDLRSQTRESQLHLALILVHIHNGIKHHSLNITPLEYAIDILKSCLNNRPLSNTQIIKVSKIVEICLERKYFSMFLMCVVLMNVTKQLREIFRVVSQKQENISEWQVSLESYWESKEMLQQRKLYKQALSRVKYIYFELEQRGVIPFKQKIMNEHYEMLGLKLLKNREKKIITKEKKQNLKLQVLKQQSKDIEEILQVVEKMKKGLVKSRKNEKESKLKEMPTFMQGDDKNKIIFQQTINELEQSYQSYQQQFYMQNEVKNNFEGFNVNNLTAYKRKVIEAANRIENLLNKIDEQGAGNLQRKLSLYPSFTPKDFIKFLFNLELIPQMVPFATKNQISSIQELIKHWLRLKVETDCLTRLEGKLRNQNVDVIEVMRECQSPRVQINERSYWNFFQVQMKLQIWLSQFQTFKKLMHEQNGIVSQLNMGQGKTQTIIPMIILSIIYSKEKKGKTPRINCLSSLYSEVYNNFYRFLSVTGFKVPILELPFQRSVKLDNETVKAIRRSFSHFLPNAILLLHQSSSHSLILKQRQRYLACQQNEKMSHCKDKTIFQGIQLFDVFDEVDALMTPMKEFVYSIGKPEKDFSELEMRIKVCKYILEEIQNLSELFVKIKKIAVIESMEMGSKDKGEYSTRLRLIVNQKTNKKEILDFRTKICNNIFQKLKDNQFKELFYESLQQQRDEIKQYIVNSSCKDKKWKVTDKIRTLIYLLRGTLGLGVLQYCLSLRYRVQYGYADEIRIKKMKLAVPYEASEVPSKKNEFSHPEVTIYLTFLTYYYEGITLKSFKDSLKDVNILTSFRKNQVLQSWLQSVKQSCRPSIKITDFDLQNQYELEKLYETFKKNKKVVEYWLGKFVMKKQMIDFPLNITSSSWDLSCVQESVGFSGTKDGAILFPTYIKYKQSHNMTIKATDARMIDLFLANSKVPIELNQNLLGPLWKVLLNQCIKQDVDCLIDVGAYLAGQSIKDQIIPYLCEHDNFNKDNRFKGIAFHYQKSWMVYNFTNKQIIGLRTLIPDHQTFVIFDQHRTRGADMRMGKNIKAMLTLSANLPKDDFMQAIGRLRKFGRNQQLVMIMTSEVKLTIEKVNTNYNKLTDKEKLEVIINWTLLNSTKNIEEYIYCHSKNARIHLQNQIVQPEREKSSIMPEDMYGDERRLKTVKQECSPMFNKIKVAKKLEGKHKEIVKGIENLFNKYGESITIKVSNFDQQTEKEMQVQNQTVKEKIVQITSQISVSPARAILEVNTFKDYSKFTEWGRLFKFESNVVFTRNFVKCTEMQKNKTWKQVISTPDDFDVNDINPEEIVEVETQSEFQFCFFLFFKKSRDVIRIMVITQRQAAIILFKDSKIKFYNPSDDQLEGQFGSKYDVHIKQHGVIALLKDVTVQSPIIKQNQLQKSLVQIKFFNGVEDFNKQQQKIIHHIIYNYKSKKNSKLSITEASMYFVKKRHMVQKSGSFLEEFANRMEQSKHDFEKLPIIY